jgi:hypothetical protein
LHELSHKGGDIENEGVVEAYTQSLLKSSGMIDKDGLQITDKYNRALENFYEFASRVDEDADLSRAVEEIYELYYKGEYESIYQLYKDKYMSTLQTNEERDEAFSFFEEVFPELEVHDDGSYKVCEV